jgi:hypothetical protein
MRRFYGGESSVGTTVAWSVVLSSGHKTYSSATNAQHNSSREQIGSREKRKRGGMGRGREGDWVMG